MFVKCKDFYEAEKLFDEMRVRNVVTWNTVICGLVDNYCGFRSPVYLGFCYFKRMLMEGVNPDYLTFNGLFRLCVDEVDGVVAGRQLHCFVVKLGFVSNCFVSSGIVDLYGKCGLVEDARWVFDGVLCRDLVLWNVMVYCYVFNCFVKEAFEVFEMMRVEGVKGDGYTFSSLLNLCGMISDIKLGKEIHGFVVKQSFGVEVLVATALVDMYAKNGMIEDACKAFDHMGAKNIVSWNTMLVGYGQNGYGREAMSLLRDMFEQKLYPNEYSVASILSSCSHLSMKCETMQIHACTVKNGLQDFLSVGNAVVNTYSKCGSIDSAFKCFSLLKNPNLISWTAIIGAFAFHGLPKQSIEVFEMMLSQGVRPDSVVFLAVLSSCSHGGLVDAGLRYFKLMKNDYQIVPNSEHYTCIVDLLGRAGLLDEAFDALSLMPNQSSPDPFAAFLGACNLHGNARLAEWAAEKLVELEPGNAVNYSVVSNMYASKGRWFEVVRTRKHMRDYCNHKVPGSSWL